MRAPTPSITLALVAITIGCRTPLLAAPTDPARAFREANPGYAERAGAFYAKEYLPEAVDQLAGAVDAGSELAATLREILRGFIADWLDGYVEGGGNIDGAMLAATLERMDERMLAVLERGQFDRYWKWRIGEAKVGNALAFLIQYRPAVARPNAEAGSDTARQLAELDRLAGIETVAATEEILAMMDTVDDPVLLHAARILSERLPVRRRSAPW